MKTSWYRGLAALVLGSLAVVAAPAAIPGTVGAGDLVWWDANTNGIQDPGEPGFPFVPVTLYRLGVAVTAMPTDLDGAYFFEDQTAGTYQVGFALPPGFLFSPRDQGGNDAVDSDPNPATGRTDPVALTPNQYTSDWDAGM